MSIDLKKLIPESQRNSDSMNEFLDASSELLTGFQTAIDSFKYDNDAKKVGESKIDDFAGQFDFTLPRNMSVSRKRDLLRDAIDLYRSNGTERALKRVFANIGWNVTIDYTYTLNPDIVTEVQYLYNGTITYDGSLGYTYNENPVVAPVGLYSLIFGNEKIYSTGVFADLYDASGGEYPKNSILGEEYGDYAESDLLVVAKAPYIRINVNEEDYELFTEDYVDPDTGKVYSYTTSEQYEITQELITYFLEQVRPANVSITEIVTPFALMDTFIEIPDVEDLIFTHIGLVPQYDGTLTYMNAGDYCDRYAMNEAFGDFTYGTNDIVYSETPSSVNFSRSYPIGADGLQEYINTCDTTQLDLTVPADALIHIYTTTDDRTALVNGTNTWISSVAYSGVTNEIINISGKFAVAVHVTTPSTIGTIDLDIQWN